MRTKSILRVITSNMMIAINGRITQLDSLPMVRAGQSKKAAILRSPLIGRTLAVLGRAKHTACRPALRTARRNS